MMRQSFHLEIQSNTKKENNLKRQGYRRGGGVQQSQVLLGDGQIKNTRTMCGKTDTGLKALFILSHVSPGLQSLTDKE